MLFLTSIDTVNGTSHEVHSDAPPVEYDPGEHGSGETEFSGQKKPLGQKPLQWVSTNPDISP